MSKLLLLLVLYAAGVATWLLLDGREPAPVVDADFTLAGEGRTEHVRELMTEARQRLRAEVRAMVKDVDLRLARIEALRKSMDEGLVATQEAAEGAARGSYSKLEALEEDLTGMGARLDGLKALATRFDGLDRKLEAIEKRIAALEARPVHVPQPPTNGGGPAAPKPPPPQEPDRPRLPTEPRKDPETVRLEIEQARADLQSNDLDVLFPAIEKVREHRVMDAVPRLLEILADYKDEFGRTAAAAALGRMEVCDAVPALAEALVDRSSLVAQQANKAIAQITKLETHLSPTARIRERRSVRNKIKEWWREHEDEVRARLGQPRR